MSLKWCVQILGLLWILSGNAEFVLSIKAQISRKKINLSKLLQLSAIFNLVKSKNSKDIFSSSKCKVTFGFKYIIQYI